MLTHKINHHIEDEEERNQRQLSVFHLSSLCGQWVHDCWSKYGENRLEVPKGNSVLDMFFGAFVGHVCVWSVVSDSCELVDCSLPGFSVLGILQARIPEWVDISSSRGSSRPRDQTHIFYIAGGFFTRWAIREVPICGAFNCKYTTLDLDWRYWIDSCLYISFRRREWNSPEKVYWGWRMESWRIIDMKGQEKSKAQRWDNGMRSGTQGRSFKNDEEGNYHPLPRSQIWKIMKKWPTKIADRFVLTPGRKTCRGGTDWEVQMQRRQET